MTTTQKPALLRIGSAKTLTRSAAEGDLKEAGVSNRFYI